LSYLSLRSGVEESLDYLPEKSERFLDCARNDNALA
jgi:hypothetical protein